MTFEQWTEEMKKGLNLHSDEKPKAPSRYDSISSWNYDRLGREMEEEETPKSSSKKN